MTKIYKHPESPDEIYGLENIYILNIDKAWYWYERGRYEGYGTILMKCGELWCLDNLGHCSCYGPTDHLTFDGVTLSEFSKKHSDGLCEEAEKLFKQAGIFSLIK